MRAGPVLARVLALALVIAAIRQLAPPAAAQSDPRYFSETGFRVDDDLIWVFFAEHGGARAFGPPISRPFWLLGHLTQIFQRHVLRITETADVEVVSLFDTGWMPYTQIGGRPLPRYDPSLTANAPTGDSANYVDEMMSYLQAYLPAEVDGYPTDFFRVFSETVAPIDPSVADPIQRTARALQNLEVWGIPTSRPLRDPTSPGSIVLRLERGFLRFEPGCRCTAPLPLGSYFRSIVTSEDLPADVELQKPDSPFLRQYDFSTQTGPYRPGALPNTDLAFAFLPSLQAPPQGVAREGGLAPTSTPVFWPATETPLPTSTPPPTATITLPPGATPIPAGTSIQGPAPGLINRAPADIALRLNEIGREGTLVLSVGGEDERGPWHRVRIERDRGAETMGLGPVIFDNKVYVARNPELARQIYGTEIAVRNFPESVDRIGPTFFVEPPNLGDDNQVIESCVEEGCAAVRYELHIRIVFRRQNVVAVFYTYGDQLSSSLTDVSYIAAKVANRMVP